MGALLLKGGLKASGVPQQVESGPQQTVPSPQGVSFAVSFEEPSYTSLALSSSSLPLHGGGDVLRMGLTSSSPVQTLTHAGSAHDASVQKPRRTTPRRRHRPDASQRSLSRGSVLRRQQLEAAPGRVRRPRLLQGR